MTSPTGTTDLVPSPPLRSWHYGWNNGCGLDAEGRVHCELLGPATAPVAEETFAEVGTASPDLACGLRADGTVRCWGSEAEQGPLADIPGQYIEQCVAPFHWCGLTATGEVRCFGEDLFGETAIPAGPVYGAVGCNQEVTCVAEVAGPVRCFGRWAGDALVPPAGLSAWRVRVGPRSACALTHDGGLTCWGDGAFQRDPSGRYTPEVGSFAPIEAWDGHRDAGPPEQFLSR